MKGDGGGMRARTCYFDKRGIFHDCGDADADCTGCKFESRMARTMVMLCHWCGKEIVADRSRAFCDERCRNSWMRERASHDHTFEGGMCWTEGFGVCPIFDEEELRECQRKMLGFVNPVRGAGRMWSRNDMAQ